MSIFNWLKARSSFYQHIEGKIFIKIDRTGMTIYSGSLMNVHDLFPRHLVSKNEEDAGTICCFEWKEVLLGNYGSSATRGYRIDCNFKVINKKTSTVKFIKTFTGTNPPESVLQSYHGHIMSRKPYLPLRSSSFGGITNIFGDPPVEEIRNYLVSEKLNARELGQSTQSQSDTVKENLVYCSICNLPFKTEDGLSSHVKNWHTVKDEKS